MSGDALTQPYEKTVAERLQRDPEFVRDFLDDLCHEFPKVKEISATGFRPCKTCVGDDGSYNKHTLCAGCYQNMSVIEGMYRKLDQLAVSINKIVKRFPQTGEQS